jgi:4-carboxymuconolactone decarboxylase
VSDETFAAAREQLGVKGLVEFTTTMGYYRLISLNANACTIELPDQVTEPILPI